MLPLPPLPRVRPACAALLVLLAPALVALDPPSVPDPIADVPRVLQFLDGIAGEKILAGQQEQVDWFGKDNEAEMEFLLEHTGRLPAVRSFDFMFTSISHPEGRRGQRVAERAIEWRRRGGLVAICFHWNAGAPDESFYTDESDFDLARALTPGHRDHDEFIAEMDVVAAELKLLRDAGVAVIWRPFHEVNGNAGPNGGPGAWFWWGNRGPEVFKQAWILMFERFTHHHGLNNLIWCYNPTAVAGALEAWYPGDAYVDLISLDIYPPAGTHPTYADVYQQFVAFKGGRKVFALSENGAIPDPDVLFADGPDAAGWSFFSTWDRDFIMGGTHNSLEFVQRVYAHEKVVTLDELPALLPTPPAIRWQAGSTTAPQGARVALSVAAAGPGELTYEWRRNGTPIPGAASPEFVIASVTPPDAGTYTVAITNSPGGTTVSTPMTLTVEAGAYAPPASRLVNLSTRGSVGVDADMMFAGFVVTGPGAKKLLIRAVGPGLTPFNVPNVLEDPALRLFDAQRRPLHYSDDWSVEADAGAVVEAGAQVGAFALADGSRDAATVVSLAPGLYSVTVRSPMSRTGTALVEVYDLDRDAASRLINVSTRARVNGPDDTLIVGFVAHGSGTRPLLVRAIGPTLDAFAVPDALRDPLMTLHDGNQREIARNDDWDAAAAPAFARTGAFGLTPGSRDAVLAVELPVAGYTAKVQSVDGGSGVAIVEVYEDHP